MKTTTHDLAAVPSTALFCILPLKWHVNVMKPYYQSYWAVVPFGHYNVERWREKETGPWDTWKMRWSFGENDEGDQDERTMKEAKAAAYKDWCGRLASALRPMQNLSGHGLRSNTVEPVVLPPDSETERK